MSGVIKYAAIAITAVAVVATAGAALAGVGLASAVGFGVGTVTTLGGALGISSSVMAGILLATAAIDLSMISSAVFPKESQGGQQTSWKADPYAGIPYVMGRTLTSGNIVARMVRGDSNMFEGFTTVLSLGPINGYETTFMNKTTMTWSHDPEIYPDIAAATNAYSGYVWEHRTRGLCPAPIAPGATEAYPNWGPDHKLSGLAAVHNTFCTNSKAKDNLTGEPQPAWIIEGVLVYDPRQDSTYPGGSGPCRALDESTYVYSENPHLHALTWLLGRWQNGIRVAGIGAPVSSIDMAPYVDGANLDDARGWKIGGQVYTRPDTPWNSLKAMLQAGGAQPVLIGGRYSCINRAPRVSLATITRNDIVGKCTLSATQSRRNRINGIVPIYRSEEHDWEMTSGAGVLVDAYIAIDGDERTKEVSYSLVQNVNQASQLATYDICDAREIGPGSVPLGPAWLNYRVGDCVTFAPEDGFSLKTIITGRGIDAQTATITYTLRGETDGKHAFALGQTGVAPAIAQYSYDPGVVAPTNDWNVAGTTLQDNGESVAALVATGACSDANADAVVFDYRVHAADQDLEAGWIGASLEGPGVTRKEITGVTSGTTYDVGVRYRKRGVIGARAIYPSITAGTSYPVGYLSQVVAGSYTDPSSDLLTAESGTNGCKITVADHDRVYTDKRVHISNVPPITGLDYDTAYTVYYDDPDRVGGAVTAIATKTPTDALTDATHQSRHSLGTITTPGEGQVATTGGGLGALRTQLIQLDQDVLTAQQNIATLVNTVAAASGDASAARADAASAVTQVAAEVARAQSAEGVLTSTTAALQSGQDNLTSTVSAQFTSLTNADEALSASISTLTTNYNGLSSTVAANYATLSDAQSSIATQVTSLKSQQDANTAAIGSQGATISTLQDQTASLTATVSSNYSGLSASISSEALARSNADNALSSRIDSLSAQVGDNAAAISSNQAANASAIGALSSSVNQLTATIASSPNLLPNGSFENGMAGWTDLIGGSFIPTDLGWGPRLGWSNLINTGGGEMAVAISDFIKVAGGATYTISADLMAFADTPSAYCYLDVIYYAENQTTQVLDGQNGKQFATTDFSTDVGKRRASAATDVAIPSNAAWARVRLVVCSGAGTLTAFGVRQIKFERNGFPTSYSADGMLTSLAASITNTNTVVATLQSQAATVEQKLSAGSPNLVKNGSAEMGMVYWTALSGGWGGATGPWGSYFNFTPGGSGVSGYYYLWSDPIPVYGQGTYTCATNSELYQAAGNSDGVTYIELIWFSDAAGTNRIGSPSEGPLVVQPRLGNSTANRNASKITATAPVGAVSCRVNLVAYGTQITSTSFASCKFEYGTVATAYSQEATILTQQQVILSTQNGVTTALARAALTLDVNGYTTGYEIANNGQTGAIKFRTDLLQISSPNGAAGSAEFFGGNWNVYYPNGQLACQMGPG